MTDLTLEELAELERRSTAGLPTYATEARAMFYCEAKPATVLRLLAMARELVRLKSALEFLEQRTFPLRALVPSVMYQQAYEHGWPDPLPPKGEG